MNDPQFVEASRALAQHAMAASPKFDARLDAVTEALLSRRFDKGEREVARRMLDRSSKQFAAEPKSARELITVGESKAEDKWPAAELASWTMVASEVMNMDEALTK